jgi:hypothetical protein
LNVSGNSGFGGPGTQGFRWGNEGGNGWSCLRTNKSDNRLCFNQDHGITHFSPGGNLEIPGRITAPNGIHAGGGIGGSTIQGTTWMNTVKANTFDATGDISAGGNVLINNELIMRTHRWHKSSDGKNRLHFSDNTGTHYGSGDGRHYFRTGANGDGPDGVTIEPGKATFSGQLCIHHVCINHDELNVLKLIARGGFRLRSDNDRCLDAGHARDIGCMDTNPYQRFNIRHW